MTRPSIFRCFFFLYRSLNFPAKKIKQTAGVARRSAVATPQQERRRRRRRSVDVVVAAVVAVVVVVGVSPRRRRCRSIASFGSCVCVCVCVCFLGKVFFLLSSACRRRSMAERLPSAECSFQSVVGKNTAPTGEPNDTRNKRRRNTCGAPFRSDQWPPPRPTTTTTATATATTRTYIKEETVRNNPPIVFRSVEEFRTRNPPPPSLLSLSLSLSLFFRVCVFTSKNSFWDVSHRCHRRPSSATLRPPRWQSVRTSTVGRR